ncbi:MAG: ATP-binding protein, partial [Clostridiales bacterium]|nr:ATP-binding protein [Clostridiales bacterium]
IEPVLAKINKCQIEEKPYAGSDRAAITDIAGIRRQVIHMLIQGQVREHLDFNVKEIEKNLASLNLSSRNREFIEEQISEFVDEGTLSVWKDENLRKLSRHVVDIWGVRSRIENDVTSAVDNADLSEKLAFIVKQSLINASDEIVIAVSQCFMKDLSVGRDETEVRERIYKAWVEFIKGSGVK